MLPPPRTWTEDDIHILLNIIRAKYTQLKRSNITAFVKDILPELCRKLPLDLTTEQFTVHQVQRKILYLKTRYSVIYEELSQSGFGFEAVDDSRSLMESANKRFTYFSRMKAFMGQPLHVSPMGFLQSGHGSIVSEEDRCHGISLPEPQSGDEAIDSSTAIITPASK